MARLRSRTWRDEATQEVEEGGVSAALVRHVGLEHGSPGGGDGLLHGGEVLLGEEVLDGGGWKKPSVKHSKRARHIRARLLSDLAGS